MIILTATISLTRTMLGYPVIIEKDVVSEETQETEQSFLNQKIKSFIQILHSM